MASPETRSNYCRPGKWLATLIWCTSIILVMINGFLAGMVTRKEMTETILPTRIITPDSFIRANTTTKGQQPPEVMRCGCDLPLPPSIKSAIFHPKRFFEEGSGRTFLPFYETMVKNEVKMYSVMNIEFIIVTRPKKSTCESIYYHLRKNGGTTVDKVLKNSSLDTRHYFIPDQRRIGRKKYNEITRDVFNNAYYKRQINPIIRLQSAAPVFTFVRDPLERFLSGLTQYMTNRNDGGALQPCLVAPKTETLSMINCVVELIQKQKAYFDVHLIPQSYDMYKAIHGNDLAFQLINLKDMDVTLASLGGATQSTTTVRKERQRKEGLLLGKFNLTTVAILTPEIKAKICNLYAMDVVMLWESGILDRTECDSYVTVL